MLSIVIPIFNEEDNVPELHAELQDVLVRFGRPYEIVYVDDGSSDASPARLKDLAIAHPEVIVVQLRRNFGQTAALAAGMETARGDILIFMDGDLQNDPAEIPRLVEMIERGEYDVVSGWRKNRQDAAISRKLPSRIANWLISRVSGVRLHDYGCTLKAYRREAIQNVRLYGEMHRFIPAYAAWAGAQIAELPVNHRARKHGRSKYGINRTIKVLLDLLTLKFLSSYSTKPIQLFGGLGALCFVAGALSFLLVLYMKFFEDLNMNRNPILLMSVFMFLAGLLFITQGLLAELVTRTYHESQGKPTYVIRRVLRRSGPRPNAADAPVARARRAARRNDHARAARAAVRGPAEEPAGVGGPDGGG